jgi:hypothetical protein
MRLSKRGEGEGFKLATKSPVCAFAQNLAGPAKDTHSTEKNMHFPPSGGGFSHRIVILKHQRKPGMNHFRFGFWLKFCPRFWFIRFSLV